MRAITKYKIFSKTFSPITSVPIKILKFHRPKWKKAQKALLKHTQQRLIEKKSNLIFKNHSILSCNSKRWDRYQQSFRTRLKLKKSIQILFGTAVSNWYLKKIFFKKNYTTYKKLIQNSLFKTEYRIDILLWRLGFFTSCSLIKNILQKNEILLNSAVLKSLTFLKKGDIIHLPKTKKLIFTSLNHKSLLFHSFLEIDYYTNTVVILKDLNSLSYKDFFLLTRSFYNILDLKDYLLK
jgi:ribosomal 50S subunit-recycling heat shock protein